MRIFISWSGERSQALGTAVREWLPLVLHYAEPWLSQADIEAGDRWSVEIAKELDACSFGITCVTTQNINSPWILFESGALAKSMEKGRVLPLLLDLDVREISGPLAQFQAKKAEKSGLMEAIVSINKASPNPEPEERVKALFEALWPQLEQKIAAIPKSTSSSKQTRSQADILEELVTSVRNLDARYREEREDGVPPRRSKRAHMRTMMAEELLFRGSRDPRDPMSIMIAASFMREEHPWLYELAADVYAKLRDGDHNGAKQAAARLFELAEIFSGGPFESEFSGRTVHMLMRVVDRAVSLAESDITLREPDKPKNPRAPTTKLV